MRLLLSHLTKRGWLGRVTRGVYIVGGAFSELSPASDYEIGAELIPGGAVAFRSAMSFHALTEQLPRHIYVIVPRLSRAQSSGGKRIIRGVEHHLIGLPPSQLSFGIGEYFPGRAPVRFTTPERTLVDCLWKPEHAGGLSEVLKAFRAVPGKIAPTQVVDIAAHHQSTRGGHALLRRLGFILERRGVAYDVLGPLERAVHGSPVPLDPAGLSEGRLDKNWRVVVNAPIGELQGS